jgi:hypothetical protein
LHSRSQYTTVKHRTHVRVRPARSRNTHSYRILPTGPLVAIYQHSLPFLQSESFQTHVGTIHRRDIGPLAHHNSTSAYSPSLTCHLPAPTIGCLHLNDSHTTLSLYQSKFRIQLILYPWRCLSIVYSITMLLVYIVIHQSRWGHEVGRVSKETQRRTKPLLQQR